MATIKAYTDIEQSKKLEEFLPLESADIYYFLDPTPAGNIYHLVVQQIDFGVKTREPEYDKGDIPCWSIAALLDILPTYLFEFERGIDLNIYPHLNGKGWHCSYMPNCIENMKKDKFKLITSEDNLVDACYEMILKLHELNLL